MSGNIYFLMHSHFEGGLPIFSVGDFETIAGIYNYNYLSTDKFFFGLSTQTGSYILTIEDSQKFQNFIATKIDIANKSQELEQIYKQYKIGSWPDNNVNIREFVLFMKDLNSGISLLKANEDFTQFSKVNVINNQLILSPCN